MKGIQKLASLAVIVFLSTPFFIALLLYFKPHVFDSLPERPLPYPEKSLVVIIPSYNNARWVEKNLSSVFKQDYTNYRVIYIDDCSSDNTFELAQQVVERYHQQWRTTLIHNEKRQGALANLYNAIHSCKDNEIVLTLDGDDWFAHNYVLNIIGNIYDNSDVWLTYGQYCYCPTGQIGCCAPPSKVAISGDKRMQHWAFSHLRTFYAWLFKSIKLEDLLYEGNFYAMTWDQAMMFPMCEMAHPRIAYVPYVVYIYNRINPINDDKVNRALQLKLEEHIKAQKPYAKIDCPHCIDMLTKEDTASIIVYSQNNPDQLKNMLKSLKAHVKNSTKIHVLYLAVAGKRKAYNALVRTFADINFTAITPATINSALLLRVNKMQDNYVVVTRDASLVTQDIDLQSCISTMKRTATQIFHLALNYEQVSPMFLNAKVPLVNRQESICAWYPSNKKDDLQISCLNMTLWNKTRLLEALKDPKINSLPSLDHELQTWLVASNSLGLFFESPRIDIQRTVS